MFTHQEIIDTLSMVWQNNLDIRTRTVGISLFDCASDDADSFIKKSTDKIER